MNNKNAVLGIYREVARIHSICLPQSFLGSLGENFLALLYEAIDSDQSSVLFVEYDKGNVVGFVAGGRSMFPIYRNLLKKWPRLLSVLLPHLLYINKFKSIIEIVSFKKTVIPHVLIPKAELFSIAVLEENRGSGVAERLFRRLSMHFIKRGESAFCIIVGDSLPQAHSFYKRMGASIIGKLNIHEGKSSTMYRYDLSLEKLEN